MDIRVLYEDNHLLVVEKPANVPVQADASGDEDLLTACKGYIKEKYQKPGEVYLGLVHRLDRPVGGVMVFARTSKAAARLTEQFSAHRARKRYAAIVEGEAPAEGRLTDFLLKNEATNTTAVVAVGTPGAKQAKLSFRTLAREKGLSLLDVDAPPDPGPALPRRVPHPRGPAVQPRREGGGADTAVGLRPDHRPPHAEGGDDLLRPAPPPR